VLHSPEERNAVSSQAEGRGQASLFYKDFNLINMEDAVMANLPLNIITMATPEFLRGHIQTPHPCALPMQHSGTQWASKMHLLHF
jgi:hypothetical protein